MLASLISDWRRHGAAWLLTALVAIFGLQELRVLFVGFVGYLRDSQGMGSLSLAPVAIGIFALSLLAGVLNRYLGSRGALWVTAGGLALLRVGEQLAQKAAVDLYLSSAAVVLFLMWVPLAVGMARAKGGQAPMHLGLAFLMGISLDSAIQIGGKTLDLSWQPGLVPLALTIAMAAALLWALATEIKKTPAATDGSWRANLALLAFGPWIFLQLLIFQNAAVWSSLTEWNTPAAGALLVAGNALALYMAAQAAWPPRSWVNVLLAGALTLLPLIMLLNEFPLSYLWLLFGQVFSMTLGMFIFLGASRAQGRPGLLSSAVLSGIGQILFVLFLFVYYASYDIAFGFRSSVLPLVALGLTTILVALSFTTSAAKQGKALLRTYSPALSALLLIVIPLALLPGWRALAAQPAASGTNSVIVLDYNLHDAVNTDGRVDPEALARVIEESGADIVGLQEVSRGWLVWGGMDMLEWLSQRLGMPYVWDATADAQWGMAILSRYPIASLETYDLPPEDIQLLRGFTVAKINVDGSSLTVINTHFSEKDDQDQIRNIQASAILDAWAGSEATVIMGDFNALPDSQAISIFLDAAFIDISREIGQQPTYTYYSANPDHQIDYIFVTPDLGYRDFYIPSTMASDHLPLVVTIELR
ncbi:MAG: endonuclease/exonuclease/phosphatase family protein [Anaerolineales bacterium]